MQAWKRSALWAATACAGALLAPTQPGAQGTTYTTIEASEMTTDPQRAVQKAGGRVPASSIQPTYEVQVKWVSEPPLLRISSRRRVMCSQCFCIFASSGFTSSGAPESLVESEDSVGLASSFERAFSAGMIVFGAWFVVEELTLSFCATLSSSSSFP